MEKMDRIFRLGVGTTWFGFPWPPGNTSWVPPPDDELHSHLAAALSAAEADGGKLLMVDTAAGYGESEARLAALFAAHENDVAGGPGLRARCFVATKCGEVQRGAAAGGGVVHDFSAAACMASIARSVELLGQGGGGSKVDLVYIHLTGQVGAVSWARARRCCCCCCCCCCSCCCCCCSCCCCCCCCCFCCCCCCSTCCCCCCCCSPQHHG